MAWTKQEAAPAASEAKPIPAPFVPPPTPRHDEPAAQAAPHREEQPRRLGADSSLLLGAGAEFEGKLTFKGTVRIDAKFRGSIVTDDVLVVGEHARIDAEIACGSVVVQGEVNGNIKAKNAVELHRSAKVHGSVETASLSIEKGALLQGGVNMASSESASGAKVSAPARAALQ